MRRHDLDWLGVIAFGLLISSLGFSNSYGPFSGLIHTMAYSAFIFLITVKDKLTPESYNLHQLRENPGLPVNPPSKVINPKVADEKRELTLLSQQVVQIIEEEQLFKELGLSINEVADKIGSQTHLVSRAINSCLGKNFFELINRYRVEEAKKLLKDESMNYLSIIGIGFEAGFNSKTSFNTSFKKYTGMTPGKFKQEGTTSQIKI